MDMQGFTQGPRFPLGDITNQATQNMNQQQWPQQQNFCQPNTGFNNQQQFGGFNQGMQQPQWNTQFQQPQTCFNQQPVFGNQQAAFAGFGQQQPQFVNQGSSQFFNFNNNTTTTNNHHDEDDDDEDYNGSEGTHDDEEIMCDNDGDMQLAEETKEGEGEHSDDEDQALQECCVPETNVLQELEAEKNEQFNLDDYLKFRAKIEQEEQMQQMMMQQQQQMYNNCGGDMEM